MKKLLLFSCSLLVFFAGCRKDFLDTKSVITYPEPSVQIRATIGGIIVDENGNAVVGAHVSTGPNVAQTDLHGFFLFKDINTDAAGSYIKIEHPSYFHGSRTVIVLPGTRNKIKVQLLSNKATKFVDGNAGGTADYTDFSVTLPGGGIESTSGVTYIGQVCVAAKWLDPTDPDFTLRMPGQLKGIRTDGSLSGMVSMGMLAVELTDGSGNKLQIKEGHEATLRMKVQYTLLSTAPETIPLWYFDETKGLWTEEGSAQLLNGFYEGKVKHFSFWNCDYPVTVIPVQLKVVDVNGDPVPNAAVFLTVLNSGGHGSGVTDNNGIIAAEVPENQQFNVQIYLLDIGCSDPVLEQQVGPFSQNEVVTFTLNTPTNVAYTITGDMVDCSGQPLSDGYVFIDEINDGVLIDNNGHFEVSIVSCLPINSITLTGYNISDKLSSVPLALNVSGGNNNAGTISVCNPIDSYLTYSFNSGEILYIPTIYKTQGPVFDTLHVNAYSINTTGYVQFRLAEAVNGTGTYTVANFYASDELNGQNFTHLCWGNCAGVTVTITKYDGPGEYIEGTFSGVFAPQVNVIGTFRGILQ